MKIKSILANIQNEKTISWYENPFQENQSCSDGACENGGICFQQPGGFLCECPALYTGMKCQNVSIRVFFQRSRPRGINSEIIIKE